MTTILPGSKHTPSGWMCVMRKIKVLKPLGQIVDPNAIARLEALVADRKESK